MGVIYKLKPEIIKFILSQKKAHPRISCRSLVKLVHDKFKVSISKSSINLVFKEAGLSMPVGRRRKKPLHQAKPAKESQRPTEPIEVELVGVSESPPAAPAPTKEKAPESPQEAPAPPKEKAPEPPTEVPAPPEEKVKELHIEVSLPPEEKPSEEKAQEEQPRETAEEIAPEELREEERPVEPAKAVEPAGAPESPQEVLPPPEKKTPEPPREIPAPPEQKEPEEQPPEEQPPETPSPPEKKISEPPPEVPAPPEEKVPEKKVPPTEKPPKEKAPEEKPPEGQPQAEPSLEEILAATKTEAEPSPKIEKPTPEAMPLMPLETERQQVESPKAKKLQSIEPQALEIPALEEGAKLECPGAILLKAADYLIGGSFYFADSIRQYIRLPQAELLARTEGAIYLPLCETLKIDKATPCPWPFLYRVFSKEELFAYLFDLKNNNELTQSLKQLASHIFQEVRCVRINYADGGSLYLDGQLHTVWSTPHIPYSFVTPIQKIKSYINNCFFSTQPFVIFTAPGYDVPPKELFTFMLGFGAVEKKAARMNIFSSKLEEVGVVPLEEGRATHFILGLWPWQFGHYRNVLKLNEFKPFKEEMSKQNVYIADIELGLTQPELEQTIQLKGCALKMSPQEKIRFVILSNIWTKKTPEELARLYLQRWPNLEESFQDYSRKIELFTYTATPPADIFSTENLSLESEQESEISMLFGNYLKILDTFVRTYFLPFGYENKDFLITSERFYSLKATVEKKKEAVVATFHPAADYKYLADLSYACRRVNEREVVLPQGYRLWLQVAPA